MPKTKGKVPPHLAKYAFKPKADKTTDKTTDKDTKTTDKTPKGKEK